MPAALARLRALGYMMSPRAMFFPRTLLSCFVVVALCLPTVVWAASADTDPTLESLSTDDRVAIRAVIEKQLDAFQRDDAETAFALAAPGIQYTFHTPERFMIMVKQGYQAVYRHSVVEFREIHQMEDAGPVQSVYIEGQDGEAVIALYPMERQPDGSWRINGCHLVRSSERRI